MTLDDLVTLKKDAQKRLDEGNIDGPSLQCRKENIITSLCDALTTIHTQRNQLASDYETQGMLMVHLEEQVKALEAHLTTIITLAGLPDANEACRRIIHEAQAALKGVKEDSDEKDH